MLFSFFKAILAFLFGGGGRDEPTSIATSTLAPAVVVSQISSVPSVFPRATPFPTFLSVSPTSASPTSLNPYSAFPTSLSPTLASPTSLSPTSSSSPTTMQPSTIPPSVYPLEDTIFYAIADLPYSPSQAVKLSEYMSQLPADAEFVIHLGDLRLARHRPECIRSEYEDAAKRLQDSHVPVFVIVGDNDWTDCPNRQEGWGLWNQTFGMFESKHWNHNFTIRRQHGRPENFSFVHKGNLFIGLNIVGGIPDDDETEWRTRLSEQLNWFKFLVRKHTAGRIILFGHANPNRYHDRYFFHHLQTFVRDEIKNKIPILYMNGDKHVWQYDENFYNQSSFLRVMLSGNAVDPPTKVTVRGDSQVPSQVFRFDRRISES